MRLVTTLRRRLPSDYSPIARLITFAAACAYTLLLWYDYKNYIHPAFEYLSFVFFAHSPVAVAMDVLLAAIPTLFLSLKIRRPSDLALMLLYILAYIPSEIFTTSVVTVVNISVMMLKVTLLLTLVVIKLVAGGDQMRPVFYVNLPRWLFMLGMAGLTVLCVGVVGLTYGFKITLHNFSDVYAQRDAFKDELQDAGYATYIIGLLTNVLGPSMVSYGILFRRPQFIAAGVMVALYVFSITGLKSSVMAVVYTVALMIGMTFIKRNFLLPFIAAVFVVVMAGLFVDASHIQSNLNALIVRRTFMIQGVMTAYFHDYYVQNPFLYLSQSILAPFMNSPQTMSPDDLIGQVYFKGGEHANASLFADGFAQAGLVGILLSGVIAGFFLRAVNWSLSRMELKFACCAISMVFFMMCQTGMIKILGTHGGIEACILFCLSDLRTRAAIARTDLKSRTTERLETRLRRSGLASLEVGEAPAK